MEHFEPLDGHVVLRASGVYSVHQVYHHDHELYARKGNGYIRLMDHQATSKSKVFWSDLTFNNGHTAVASKAGRMVLRWASAVESYKAT